jgi:hypothetical protein
VSLWPRVGCERPAIVALFDKESPMQPHLRILALAGVLMSGPVIARTAQIEHSGVGCVVADRFPRLEAKIAAVTGTARVRAYFRAEGTQPWYFVEMKSEAGSWWAALPKPKKSLHRLSYYLEATGAGFETSRTTEYSPTVAQNAGECGSALPVATTAAAARIAVVGPAGAPAVPPGFAGSGVAATSATGAGAAAAGGKGVSTGLLVGVAAGGAAVAGGVLLATASDDEAIDVSGRWAGTSADAITLPGVTEVCQQTHGLVTDLIQSGTNISGTGVVTLQAASGPRFAPGGSPFGPLGPIDPCDVTEVGRSWPVVLTGTLNGSSVVFTAVEPGTADWATEFSGTVQGRQMSGSSRASSQGANLTGSWTLTKQ